MRALSKNWDIYNEDLYQAALNSEDGYRPGNNRYLAIPQLVPEIQANVRWVDADRGANADHFNTGGTLIYLSPGLKLQVRESFSLYGFGQLPIYRNLEEGKPAPELTATLLDGKKFSLKSLKGYVVLINFAATWCEPCLTEMPILQSYYKAQHKNGLELLVISMDRGPTNEEKARRLFANSGISTALFKDADFKAYGRIWRLPLTFVIDRQGTLRKDGWTSKHGLTALDLEQVVTPLL